MSATQPEVTGQVTVQLVDEGVVEVRSVGYVTRQTFIDALARLTALCAEHPRAQGLLWDTSELDGYEPGNTALAMKWIAQHVQVRRAAVVTRVQSVASLVHLGRVMIPGLETRAFRDEDEALTWFATPFTGRPRTRSGRFKAA